MTKLLVYKKNGGNIYDLVMLQKEQERLKQQAKIQDELIRCMRRSGTRYESSFHVDLPAIHVGHKTGLYHALRRLVGKWLLFTPTPKLSSSYIAEYLSNYQNPERNIHEYTDNMVRYLRLTKYIYIRGGGYYIDLNSKGHSGRKR